MLFSELDSLSDVFCFCAANTHLMILGEKHLCALMPCVPNWQGDRLICLSDNTKEDDLPEGLLTQEYLELLRTPPTKPKRKKNCVPPADSTSRDTTVFRPVNLRFMDSQKPALLLNFRNSIWECSYSTYMKYVQFCDKLTYFSAITTQTEVLWNLSRRVYVRSEVALAEFMDLDWVVDEDKLMGTILLILICRNSSDITKKRPQCSQWAGERFEFTEKETLEYRLKKRGDGWKDVSKESVELFVAVSKKQYGKNWKKCMRIKYCL